MVQSSKTWANTACKFTYLTTHCYDINSLNRGLSAVSHIPALRTIVIMLHSLNSSVGWMRSWIPPAWYVTSFTDPGHYGWKYIPDLSMQVSSNVSRFINMKHNMDYLLLVKIIWMYVISRPNMYSCCRKLAQFLKSSDDPYKIPI